MDESLKNRPFSKIYIKISLKTLKTENLCAKEAKLRKHKYLPKQPKTADPTKVQNSLKLSDSPMNPARIPFIKRQELSLTPKKEKVITRLPYEFRIHTRHIHLSDEKKGTKKQLKKKRDLYFKILRKKTSGDWEGNCNDQNRMTKKGFFLFFFCFLVLVFAKKKRYFLTFFRNAE